MENYIISVVSYKRPNNTTCQMLLQTSFNWNVFVYSFDEHLEEYKVLYNKHVVVIKNMKSANLAKKRQTVLNSAIKNYYKYCIMLDDDITSISFNNKQASINEMIKYMLKMISKNNNYVALSAAYNKSDNDNIISDYKNICNNSVFNIQKYKLSDVQYNPESKCEDMEFTVDLLLKHYLTGKLEKLIVKNKLQGGQTNDGLSYRFNNKNRFIEEGFYITNKYNFITDGFEYDENHFKMKSDAIKKYIEEN